mgnify:CR=1 FL=1
MRNASDYAYAQYVNLILVNVGKVRSVCGQIIGQQGGGCLR